MLGTCSKCKRKNVEVRKIHSFQLCESCQKRAIYRIRHLLPTGKAKIYSLAETLKRQLNNRNEKRAKKGKGSVKS